MTKDLSSGRELRFQCEEYAREQWGPRVTEQENTIRELKYRLVMVQEKESRLHSEAEEGRALKKMLKAINENPAAKAFWDKTMAMMRLAD